MRDTMIIALEASFELDPIRMENKLWAAITKNDAICNNPHEIKENVEDLSKEFLKMRQPCSLLDTQF